ncbi:MAG: hypothetical protein NAG76_18410 [Candidatus Pristimantibacillus lignocellulolyticus]|uniref:Lipoprotein n=1 Tax=Candidatus Pristimantibacillus lignocellulolyticus TaxID=2994561 RepID=A0A9J6ZCE8_9BACL|nr:MAG: hypothetical protein NAG76_18410 [Candidatus Pristimantibacillus lignocellulolyticus]
MRYFLAALLIMISIGCSNESITKEITLIEPDQINEVSFTDKSGRATIVHNMTRGVDIIVSAKDLNPAERYEITIFQKDGERGVTFGPEANLDIKMGSIEGETILLPNQNGDLYVSMLNPERIFSDAEQLTIVVSTTDQKVVLESYPFKLK